jgi:hypothetical protein
MTGSFRKAEIWTKRERETYMHTQMGDDVETRGEEDTICKPKKP